MNLIGHRTFGLVLQLASPCPLSWFTAVLPAGSPLTETNRQNYGKTALNLIDHRTFGLVISVCRTNCPCHNLQLFASCVSFYRKLKLRTWLTFKILTIHFRFTSIDILTSCLFRSITSSTVNQNSWPKIIERLLWALKATVHLVEQLQFATPICFLS